MNRTAHSIVVAALCALAATAHAAPGNAAAGKAKAATCAACHGPDGNSPTPAFPRIAGQHEDYIRHSLKAYKSGTRKNEIMKGIAAPLSPKDIDDLAAYFASQPGLVVKR